jgi:hypothetical protein
VVPRTTADHAASAGVVGALLHRGRRLAVAEISLAIFEPARVVRTTE